MIIAFNGKREAGKDLAAEICQYIIDRYTYEKSKIGKLSEEDFYVNRTYIKHNSNQEIVKFADKIKDFVCMLTGCSRKDLENQDFKNSELPEEWWFYGFGEIPRSIYSTIKIPYLSNGYDEKDLPEVNEKYLYKPTYRDFLQYIGTELFRKQFHKDTWVNATFSNYIPKKIKGKDFEGNLLKETRLPDWFITDLRFENELERVELFNGTPIKIIRKKTSAEWYKDVKHLIKINSYDGFFNGQHNIWNEDKITYQEFHEKLINCRYEILNEEEYKKFELVRNHDSETGLDDIDLKYTIINDGTIGDLIPKFEEILLKEKIIQK